MQANIRLNAYLQKIRRPDNSLQPQGRHATLANFTPMVNEGGSDSDKLIAVQCT